MLPSSAARRARARAAQASIRAAKIAKAKARARKARAARRQAAAAEAAKAQAAAAKAAAADAAAAEAAQASRCDPDYSGCLDPNASDYDCEGGSGNGPSTRAPSGCSDMTSTALTPTETAMDATSPGERRYTARRRAQRAALAHPHTSESSARMRSRSFRAIAFLPCAR